MTVSEIAELDDLSFMKEPDVIKEMTTNMKLALFLCGICIVFYAVNAFKSISTKNKSLKKL